MRKPLLFSIQSYDYLRTQLMRSSCFCDGQVERKIFPDGERYLRILTDLRGQDALVIGGTTGDSDTMELYQLVFGLVSQGARRVTVIIPYFSYSTMERDVLPGEVVTAKCSALMLSKLPCPPG